MTTAKIVVGYDRSPQSRRAAAWALDEAARTGAPVEFLYAYELAAWIPAASMIPAPAVPPEEQIRRDAADALDEVVTAARKTHPGVTTTSTIVDAVAAVSLIDRSTTAQLVVVGSHGHSAVSGLLGSVSVAVSARAHCPVVVVRGAAVARGPVVAAVDDSAASDTVLAHAFEQATARGTSVVAVRAWKTAGGTVPADLRLPFEELVAGWQEKSPGVPVVTRAVVAHPAAALTEATLTAQLLVMGTHGRGALRGLLLGSVSQHLLRHAACPVMVIRPQPGS